MHIDLSLANWAAVGVAAVAAFLLGGIWYSALFGKLWIRLQGWDEARVAELKAKMSPAKFLAGMLLSYLVVAVAMELLVVSLHLRGAAAGACLGGIVWLGMAGIGFTGHLASARRLGLYVIDTAFQFVALVTQGIILSVWR